MNNIDIYQPAYIAGLMRFKAFGWDFSTLDEDNKKSLIVLLSSNDCADSLLAHAYLRNTYILEDLLFIQEFSRSGSTLLHINNKYLCAVDYVKYYEEIGVLHIETNGTTLEFGGVSKITI